MLAGKKTRLPSAYQEVEYLGSSRSQYIVSDYISASADIIEAKVKFTSLAGGNNGIIIGSGNGLVSFNALGTLPSTGFFCQWNINTNSFVQSGIRDTEIHVLIADFNSRALTVDGVLFTNPNAINYVPTNYPCYIFANNNFRDNVVNYLSAVQVFSLTITRQGNVIKNYVPCYRRSDSKPGLYDLENDVFYTNSGTGEFNVGPDVN